MSQISGLHISRSKRLSAGVCGVVALTLSVGAVQFASGRDLDTKIGSQETSAFAGPAEAVAPAVNRSAKTNRVAGVAKASAPMQTISLRLNGLSDTSVLVRVPYARDADNTAPARSLIKSGTSAPTVACEPMVSVLTEVARHLGPGRCVT